MGSEGRVNVEGAQGEAAQGEGAQGEGAQGKVNLYLHVVGRRPDGYHLLDSLAVFAKAQDEITYEPAETLELRLTGPFGAALLFQPNNLVLRAAEALAAAAGIRPTGLLTLDKQLPIASGIGGGSADAAAALRLLSRVWAIDPRAVDLPQIAARLGADVPVCLHGRASRMGGVGERLTEAPDLPPCGILLVNPGIPLATVTVFRARNGGYSSAARLPGGWNNAASMVADLAVTRNDLEAAAISLVPEIEDVSRAIAGTPGCLLARMSGSGATCFGLFATGAEAEAAARHVASAGWWCWGGWLAE